LRAATVHKSWGDGDSLSDITVIEGRCGTPVHASNDAYAFCELVRALGSPNRRKHVVRQVVDIVPNPPVGFNKCFDMPSGARDCVHERQAHINETDNVIHSSVRVAMRFYVVVCRPAVTDECSAEFDSVTKDSH
jgi:hypothetical protein